MKSLMVRNKNALREMLGDGLAFEKIQILAELKADKLTLEILELAKINKVPIEYSEYEQLPRRREGNSREVIVGYFLPTNIRKLEELIDEIYNNKQTPYFLLLNRVDFANNIGMIVRTAYAMGVNGLVFQGEEEKFYNEDTVQFSLGTIGRLPVVNLKIFEALKILRQNDIRTIALDMDGNSLYETDLKGPLALVLGAEAEGVSDEVIRKCTGIVSIPMQKGIDSLNVGISVGMVMSEKSRQEMLE